MKKALKLFSTILFVITIALLVVALSACDNSTSDGSTVIATEGLAYKLNGDGQSYSAVGMGDATDKDIVIASEYNELPVTAIADSAYAEYSFLTSVKIPNSVVKVGASAFAQCTGLQSIVIPDSVTEIGESAFANCSGLTSVTIGEGVVTVGESAFDKCEELATIYWNAVNYLEVGSNSYRSIFYGCYKISKVEFGQNVESIPSYMLTNCYGITSISIPNSVTTIGKYAFGYCGNITEITIPNNVTEIGNSAFYGCSSLKKVYWNATACTKAGSFDYFDKYYGNQTIFQECSKLDKIIIGDNVTAIPSYAFYDCGNVTDITIPASVKSIDACAFSQCYKLVEVCNLSTLSIEAGSTSNGNVAYYAKRVYNSANSKSCLTTTDDGFLLYEDDNEICLLGYFGDQTEITLPIKANGKQYVVYNKAFFDYWRLTSVTIPDGVTTIGDSVFYNCSGLKSIVIPNSVTTIGDSAFYNCRSLKSIVIPNGVTTIGDSAFYNCSIESATIPMLALSSISTSKLQTLVLTSGSSIGNWAFYGCRNLTSITIPDSVTSIGEYAFDNCFNLTSVYYMGDIAGWCNIDFVAYDANPLIFAHNLYIDNELVTELIIPDTVTEIKSYAFYCCTSITSITISASVTSIGSCAFLSCTKLTSVYYTGDIANWCNISFGDSEANPLHYANSLYIDNKPITELVIPDTVVEVKDYAFYGCSITSLIISKGVTSIGNSAFSNCKSITSVIIPESVTSIGNNAFYYCINIEDIIFEGTIDQWELIKKGKNWHNDVPAILVICSDEVTFL